MKFLTDVNASGVLAQWLDEMGYDVVRVADRDARMSDEDVLTWALQEQRILVTTDNDFEEMIWRQGKPHCGVLRLENLSRAERRQLLVDVLAHHADALRAGAIVEKLSGAGGGGYLVLVADASIENDIRIVARRAL